MLLIWEHSNSPLPYILILVFGDEATSHRMAWEDRVFRIKSFEIGHPSGTRSGRHVLARRTQRAASLLFMEPGVFRRGPAHAGRHRRAPAFELVRQHAFARTVSIRHYLLIHS